MNKRIKVMAVVLALLLAVSMPVHAADNGQSRESAFFSSYCTFLYKTSPITFEVWFDVDVHVREIFELGASEIEVYQSADQQSWTLVKTYKMEDYPEMIDENTGSHVSHVTYSPAFPGFYYKALITLYARNSTGFAERYIYTDVLRM